MRVVFFGTPDFAVASLKALLRERISVVGVVTQPDKPQGRSRSALVPPPVKVVAQAEGLPVLQPTRPVGDLFLAATERARPSPADKSFGVSSTSVVAICTGAKDGATCSDVRACRRQVKTRLAATPLRRATSVTFAPGANVSSTIRALSSCDQRRRRSSPPKTSTRIA